MQQAKEEPVFESGRIVLRTGHLRLLKVSLKTKTIDVSIEDKEFIKRVLKLRSVIAAENLEATEKTEAKKKKKGGGSVETLRTVAEGLSSRGITLTVSYKGNRLITIGADAKSTLLQVITGTRKVAINSIIKLAQIIA